VENSGQRCASQIRKKQSRSQAHGATNEGIAAFIETKLPIDGTRNADSNADADGTCFRNGRAEPQGAGPRAKIDPIVAFIDFHGLSEAAGTASGVEQPRRSPVTGHELNTRNRLEGANQCRTADAGFFAADVEQPARSVDEVNVGVPVLQKQGAVRRREPAKGMARFVADGIRFCLDDAPAESTGRQVVDKSLANQVARKRDRIDRELGARKAPQAPCRRFSRVQLRNSRCWIHGSFDLLFYHSLTQGKRPAALLRRFSDRSLEVP
jgi:hypothetical protein